MQTPAPASALFLTLRPPRPRPRVDWRVSEMKSVIWVSGNAAAGAGSIRGDTDGLRHCPHPVLPQKPACVPWWGADSCRASGQTCLYFWTGAAQGVAGLGGGLRTRTEGAARCPPWSLAGGVQVLASNSPASAGSVFADSFIRSYSR